MLRYERERIRSTCIALEDNDERNKLLSDIYIVTFYVKKNETKDFSTDTYMYVKVLRKAAMLSTK